MAISFTAKPYAVLCIPSFPNLQNGTTHKLLQQSVNVYVEMLLMQIFIVQHISCIEANLLFGFKMCTI